MKDSLIHPLLYILIFLLLLFLAGSIQILSLWGASFNPSLPHGRGWVIHTLPTVYRNVLPVAVIGALFLLHFRLKKKPGVHIVSFALLLICSTGLFVAGASLSEMLCRKTECGPSPDVRGEERLEFTSDSIHRTGSESIYVFRVDDSSDILEGVAELLPEGEPPHLTWYKNREPFSLSVSNPLFSPSFDPPPFLTTIQKETSMVNQYIYRLQDASPTSYIFALCSICFFSLSSGMILRISKWKVFNALCLLFVFRAVFLLFRVLQSDIADELISILPDRQIESSMPTISFLILGLLFLTIDVLFFRTRMKAEK